MMKAKKKTVIRLTDTIEGMPKKKGLNKKAINLWKMVRYGSKGLGVVVFGVVLMLVIVMAYLAAYNGKIVPGVQVSGVEVGNLTGEQAAKVLEARLERDGERELVIRHEERVWRLNDDNLGIEISVPLTINQAWMVARSGNIWERFGEAQRSFFEGVNLPLEVSIDEDLWLPVVASISAEIEVTEIKPSLRIETAGGDKEIVYEQGQAGLEVDEDRLKQMILEHRAWLDDREITLPVKQLRTEVSEESVKKAITKAEKLIGGSLIVKLEDNEWVLGEEELVGMIAIGDDATSRDRISELVTVYSEGVNREPQNAVFRFENGRVVEFAPGKEGITVKEDDLMDRLVEALDSFNGKNKIVVETPVEKKEPVVSTAEVNNMGIKELIGRGKSTYLHSIINRVHNVSLAARRIGGTLVAPGEVFSFNQTLGEVSQATGYKPAYVISSGRTVLGDGGGVCQVSTTLFRSVLDAGLPIIERKPHSYRVSYYEQDSKPGIDATVYDPSVDFKFRNDTPGYILIQAIVNEAERTLVFELYGTDDGREVTLGEPKVWGQSAPPPPLYQDDPSLPVGVIKQIDWAAWGAKTSFEYKVTRDGEVLQDETFYSNYRPWQAVYLRGTGGQ